MEMNKMTVTLERTESRGNEQRTKMNQRKAMDEIHGMLSRYRAQV